MDSGSEVSKKIRMAIKAKLEELGAYVDEELPDYIMVMIANKKTRDQMTDDLNLFLGRNSNTFTKWLHEILERLQSLSKGEKAASKKKSKSSEKQTKETKKVSKSKTKLKKTPEKARKSQPSPAKKVSPKVPSSAEQQQMDDVEMAEDVEEADESRGAIIKQTVAAATERLSQELTGASVMVPRALRKRIEPPSPPPVRSVGRVQPMKRPPPPSPPAALVGRLAPAAVVPPSPPPPALVEPPAASTNTTVAAATAPHAALFARAMHDAQRATREQLDGTAAPAVVPAKRRRDNDDGSDAPEEGESGSSSSETSPRPPSRRHRSSRHKSSTSSSAAHHKHRHHRRHSKSKSKRGSKHGSKRKVEVRNRVRRAVSRSPSPSPESDDKPPVDNVLVVDLDQSAETAAAPRTRFVVTMDGLSESLRERLEGGAADDAPSSSAADLSTDSAPAAAAHSAQSDASTESVEVAAPTKLRAVETAEPLGDLSSLSATTAVLPGDEDLLPMVKADQPDPATLYQYPVHPLSIQLDDDDDDESNEIDAMLEATDGSFVSGAFEAAPRVRPPAAPHAAAAAAAGAAAAGKPAAMASTERCRFWPHCRAADRCPFAHPSQPCRAFPTCKFADRCLFVHPACKFDGACTKPRCPYAHSAKKRSPAAAAVAKPMMMMGGGRAPPPKSFAPLPVACKFGTKCSTFPACPFKHPEVCKFGEDCAMTTCPFLHPQKRVRPSAAAVAAAAAPSRPKPLVDTSRFKWKPATSA